MYQCAEPGGGISGLCSIIMRGVGNRCPVYSIGGGYPGWCPLLPQCQWCIVITGTNGVIAGNWSGCWRSGMLHQWYPAGSAQLLIRSTNSYFTTAIAGCCINDIGVCTGVDYPPGRQSMYKWHRRVQVRNRFDSFRYRRQYYRFISRPHMYCVPLHMHKRSGRLRTVVASKWDKLFFPRWEKRSKVISVQLFATIHPCSSTPLELFKIRMWKEKNGANVKPKANVLQYPVL